MSTIGTPIQIPELFLTPEPGGGVQLTENMQQALALLAGYWQNRRVLLKATPSGILCITSPQIKNVFHVTATSTNYTYVGDNIECSEILIMGHPSNTGLIWVKPHATATTDNAWPLAKSEVLGISITNLDMLNLLIAVNAEKAIIAYTD
jgi:hypothetical protein